MTTYLVTGGAGFIGSNFIQYLYDTYDKDIQVINLDKLTYAANKKNLKGVEGFSSYHFIQGDICNKDLIEEILKCYNIDYIVHFAAESHVDRSIKDGKAFMQTNVMGTYILLNCVKDAWEADTGFKEGKRFLYVSTDEVYGSLEGKGYFTEESPLNPRNPYAASKASADMMTKTFFDTYRLPTLRTRCSNNYGPHQYSEKLIPYFLKKAFNKEKLPVYGDGLAIRDWLYVKDHCKAIDFVLQKGILGEVYNIGGHKEKTTLEIGEILIHILKKDYDYEIPEDYIDFVPDRKGHDRRYAISPEKIQNELGWHPDMDFYQGVKETIDWYVKQEQAMYNI